MYEIRILAKTTVPGGFRRRINRLIKVNRPAVKVDECEEVLRVLRNRKNISDFSDCEIVMITRLGSAHWVLNTDAYGNLRLIPTFFVPA